VTVEAPPPAEVHVGVPVVNAQITLPDQRPRAAVARKNGDGSIHVTYDDEESLA
jgi:hypothetical protein